MARKDSPGRRTAVAAIKMGLASVAVVATGAGWVGLGMADPQNSQAIPVVESQPAEQSGGIQPPAGMFAPPSLQPNPPASPSLGQEDGAEAPPRQPIDPPSIMVPPDQSNPAVPRLLRPRARTRSSR